MPKIGRPSIPLCERFWSKVAIIDDKNSCWLWRQGKDSDGYGQIWVNEKIRRARAPRVVWFLTTGNWPKKLVLHICDVPMCVRPSHLWLGTNLENSQDCARKGRSACNINPSPGEKNGNSRLKIEQIKEIRRRYSQGEFQKSLAKAFVVSKGLISQIVLRKAWRSVE